MLILCYHVGIIVGFFVFGAVAVWALEAVRFVF